MLELLLGGELYGHLRKRGSFEEAHVRFYAAQTILAFQCMHDHDIAYRDLKPENLVLDEKGYLKARESSQPLYRSSAVSSNCRACSRRPPRRTVVKKLSWRRPVVVVVAWFSSFGGHRHSSRAPASTRRAHRVASRETTPLKCYVKSSRGTTTVARLSRPADGGRDRRSVCAFSLLSCPCAFV